MKGKGQGADETLKVSMVWCAGWHGMGRELGFEYIQRMRMGGKKVHVSVFFFVHMHAY